VARVIRRWQPNGTDQEGFGLTEFLVAVALFGFVAVALLQTLLVSLAISGRSDELASATTLANQVIEQVRASANPYTMVGFTDLARSSLPLLAPYAGVTNPTGRTFQLSVDIEEDPNLTLSTVTVRVYRPSDADAAPLFSLTTVLDDK
jgi:type II secretory pathway pseudopilin PulG